MNIAPEDQRPCINDCTTKGHDDTEPAATHGHLCDNCYSRTQDALKLVPELIEHLVKQYEPSTSRQVQEVYVAPSGANAKLPFNSTAFDAANELYKMVAWTARRMAIKLKLDPPALAAGAWQRAGEREVLGLPNHITSEQAAIVAGRMSTWLLNHLPAIAILPAVLVAEVDPVISDRVFRIANTWPREARSQFSEVPHIFTTALEMVSDPVEGEAPVSWAVTFTRPQDVGVSNDTATAACGGRIILNPPRFEGDREIIVCASCRTELATTEYEAVVTAYTTMRKAERNAADRARAAELRRQKRAAEVQQSMADLEQHTSQKVMAHLIAKYVTKVG